MFTIAGGILIAVAVLFGGFCLLYWLVNLGYKPQQKSEKELEALRQYREYCKANENGNARRWCIDNGVNPDDAYRTLHRAAFNSEPRSI